MDGSEDEKVKIPQLLIRNSGRMVPIMRYSRIADISWTFGRCSWCLGGEGCFLHCGRQTQRFSSIGGVQERDLRIWHQVVECCPLLASRRTVSDRKWENSTTSGKGWLRQPIGSIEMLRNLRCWDPSLVSKVRLRCIKPVMLKMFALALFPQKMHPTLSPLYPSKPFLVIPTSLAEDNFGEELFLLVIVASSWAYQSGWTGRHLCMIPQVPECLWLESVPLQSEQKIVGLCTSITHH